MYVWKKTAVHVMILLFKVKEQILQTNNLTLVTQTAEQTTGQGILDFGSHTFAQKLI